MSRVSDLYGLPSARLCTPRAARSGASSRGGDMSFLDAGRTYVWAPVRARRGAASLGHGPVVVLETRHRTGLGLVRVCADERVFKSDSPIEGRHLRARVRGVRGAAAVGPRGLCTSCVGHTGGGARLRREQEATLIARSVSNGVFNRKNRQWHNVFYVLFLPAACFGPSRHAGLTATARDTAIMGLKEIIDRSSLPEPGEHHGTSAFASSITALTSAIAGVVRPLVFCPPSTSPSDDPPPHPRSPTEPAPRHGAFVGAILFMRNFGEQMAI